jgi:hypothetical protein
MEVAGWEVRGPRDLRVDLLSTHLPPHNNPFNPLHHPTAPTMS